MDGPTRRGSYAVGIERRERILDAAMTRFAESGYSRTSLADIARDVGLTGPGLKHHFPTKQHLLLAIAERRFDLSHARALSSASAEDSVESLRVMYDVARFYDSQPQLMELFVLVSAEAADPTNAAHALFAARYERVIQELVDGFERDVEAGRLRPDRDYRALARECIAVADGLQLQWVLSGGELDFLALSRAHLERLAADLLLPGARLDLG